MLTWLLIVSFLAIYDRFDWNVWPRQMYRIGSGGAGGGRLEGYKTGPWYVVLCDIVAPIFGSQKQLPGAQTSNNDCFCSQKSCMIYDISKIYIYQNSDWDPKLQPKIRQYRTLYLCQGHELNVFLDSNLLMSILPSTSRIQSESCQKFYNINLVLLVYRTVQHHATIRFEDWLLT